jgi:hypothetical protein
MALNELALRPVRQRFILHYHDTLLRQQPEHCAGVCTKLNWQKRRYLLEHYVSAGVQKFQQN